MAVSDEMFWTVLRERDLYRSTREAAIAKVETTASTLRSPEPGTMRSPITGYVIDIDTWREVRALLRMEPSEYRANRPAEGGDSSC